MGKYFYNKDFFQIINTEEKAYWLGFLYADGCINRAYRNEKLKSMDLEIGLSIIDKIHLEKFKKSINSNIEIKEKYNKLNNKEYKSCRVVVCCTKMCNDLINKGCTPQKSLILKFPTNNIIPNYLIRHFIRGYFDGDGCINKPYNMNTMKLIFVGTLDFLNGIKNVFINNKILRSNPIIVQKGQAYQMYIGGNDNIQDIYNYLYNNCNIYLDRKYKKFNNILQDIDKHRQNQDSKKRGVYLDKRANKWIATITINKKRKCLGRFNNLNDAIKIRKEKEIEKMNNAEKR